MPTGYVYKLCSTDVNVTEVYVGSTKSLRNRKAGHKQTCENPNDKNHHYAVYEYIRNNGGWDNWEMIVLETVEYNEQHELRARERHWLETLKATLNCKVPNRSVEEWREDNKEEIKRKKHDYHEAHKEEIHQKKHDYHIANADHIRAKVQAWRAADPERAKISDRQKYLNCQERIKSYRSEKLTCECGIQYTRGHAGRHLQTKRHADLLAAKNNSAPIIQPTDNDERVSGTDLLQQL